MRRSWGTAAILALVCCAVWVRPLFLGETFLLRDHVSATLPSRAYLSASLLEGRIPEWWPAIGLGSNFAANPNHGVTYPVAWMVALLPDGFGADLLLVLHVLFGALGVALCSRRLGAGVVGERVAGATFAASGYVGSMFINAIPLLTLAWTPWIAFAALGLREAPSVKRWLFVVALVAAQVASGDPAGMITSALVAGAIVLPAWRTFGWLVAAWPAAFVLAAVAVFPAVALLGESSRAGGVDPVMATGWSLHPLRILALVWPRLLGDVTNPELDLGELAHSAEGELTGGWAFGLYVGVPVLVLAASSGQRKLLVVAGLFVLLALGRFTPLYGLWRFVFLPERLIRYPEKHIAGTLVLLTALGGVGLTRLLSFTPRWVWVALGAGAATLGGAVAWLALAPPDVSLGGPQDLVATFAEIRAGGVVAIVSIIGLGLALRLRAHRLGAGLAFAALVLPMVSESWNLQLLGPRSRILTPPDLLVGHAIAEGQGAAPRGPWARLYRPQDLSLPAEIGHLASGPLAHLATAFPNIASRFGVAYVPGYDPAIASRLRTFWDFGIERRAGARLLGLLGVEWAILAPGVARQTGFRPVARASNGSVVLLANPNVRPRAFVTPRFFVDPDEATLRDRRFSPDSDPMSVRLVDPIDLPAGTGPLVACTLDPTPAEVVVQRCSVAAPGLAVVLDAWAPGWTADLDGVAVPVHRIDSIVRGVVLASPGEHVITYRYRAPGLRLGAIVSLVAWVLWIALWWRVRRLPPKGPAPEAP